MVRVFFLACGRLTSPVSSHNWAIKRERERDKLSLLEVKVLVAHSCLTLCNPMDWQAPLPMEFSRQEYWSGWPFPSPGDLPDSGIKPGSPTFQADSLLIEPSWGKPLWSLTRVWSLIIPPCGLYPYDLNKT